MPLFTGWSPAGIAALVAIVGRHRPARPLRRAARPREPRARGDRGERGRRRARRRGQRPRRARGRWAPRVPSCSSSGLGLGVVSAVGGWGDRQRRAWARGSGPTTAPRAGTAARRRPQAVAPRRLGAGAGPPPPVPWGHARSPDPVRARLPRASARRLHRHHRPRRRPPPGRRLVPAGARRPDPAQQPPAASLVHRTCCGIPTSRCPSSTTPIRTAGWASPASWTRWSRTSAIAREDIVALAHRYHPEGPTASVDRPLPHPAAGDVPRPRHRHPRPPGGLTPCPRSGSASSSGRRRRPGRSSATPRCGPSGPAPPASGPGTTCYSIVGPWEGPILEGWSILAGWAQVTERASLGLMVGANTFRNPGLTAKLATTLDHLSGGRAVLGIGGAWFEPRARGVRDRLRVRVRRAPGPARRVRDAPAPAARRGAGHPRRTRLPDERTRWSRPLPVQATPADHDRRQRAEEDAADPRPVRRPVERQRHAPRSWRRPTPSCAGTARPSAATRRRSSARRPLTS